MLVWERGNPPRLSLFPYWKKLMNELRSIINWLIARVQLNSQDFHVSLMLRPLCSDCTENWNWKMLRKEINAFLNRIFQPTPNSKCFQIFKDSSILLNGKKRKRKIKVRNITKFAEPESCLSIWSYLDNYSSFLQYSPGTHWDSARQFDHHQCL